MIRRVQAGLVALTVIALTAGAALWLRDSRLVAVTNVEITGVTASDGDQVTQALTAAAHEMTTLHVREDALRRAVARYSSVGDVTARKDFPHTLTIQVIERRPVAAIAGDGGLRVPVTGSGILLRGITAERDLPSVYLPHAPAGTRVTDRKILNALQVAAHAPEPLR